MPDAEPGALAYLVRFTTRWRERLEICCKALRLDPGRYLEEAIQADIDYRLANAAAGKRYTQKREIVTGALPVPAHVSLASKPRRRRMQSAQRQAIMEAVATLSSGCFRVRDVRALCPEVSQFSVSRALNIMASRGELEIVRHGRPGTGHLFAVVTHRKDEDADAECGDGVVRGHAVRS